jgi:glycolate oxidase iron-sulfur subunit
VRFFNPILPKSMRLVQHKLNSNPVNWPNLPEQPTVLLLNGCVQSVLAPQINQDCEFLLHKLGVNVINTNYSGCCGALAYHLQKHELGLDHARRQIDSWWQHIGDDSNIAAIIITASGCGSFVKEYASILAHDPEYAHKAKIISNLAKDLTEFIQPAQLLQFNLPSVPDKIAVHTPCSLQHVQKLPHNLTNLVKALGYSTVAVESEHLCCGSAGSYSLLQPKIAHELKLRKLNYLQAEQPDLIATANIGCLAHLAQDAKVPVLHWVQLAAQRLNT